MKKIKVDLKNADKIMAAINAVQGRATERIIVGYSKIETICNDVEKRLWDVLPSYGFKKALEGTTFWYDARQYFPKCYKWRAYSTQFRCEYHKGNWYLTEVCRDVCPNGNYNYPYGLNLSESAKEALLKTFT